MEFQKKQLISGVVYTITIGLLSTVLCQSIVEDSEFSCVGRPCGRYPKIGSCTEFYVCEGGENGSNDTEIRTQLRSCDHGLHFDANRTICDLPQYASCQEFSCENRTCGLYPDPQNCSSYFECHDLKNSTENSSDNQNGTVSTMVTLHRTCPHGLQFSADLKSCDLPEYVQCGAEANSTTTVEMEATTMQTTSAAETNATEVPIPRFRNLVPHEGCFWPCTTCEPMTEQALGCNAAAVCELNVETQEYCQVHYICSDNLPGSIWCASKKDCVLEDECPEKCTSEF